jgi:dUTP pyrophosphatase
MEIYRIDKRVEIPRRRRYGDAGMDLQITEDVTLTPGSVVIAGTGVMIYNQHALIRERTKWARRGVLVLGGVVDSNYMGEIKLILTTCGDTVTIPALERVANYVPISVVEKEGVEVDEAYTSRGSERGDRMFGSSDFLDS